MSNRIAKTNYYLDIAEENSSKFNFDEFLLFYNNNFIFAIFF